jgi:hypothetical protein
MPSLSPVIADGSDGGAWVTAHRDQLRAALRQAGTVLVRGLRWDGPADLARIRAALGAAPARLCELFAGRQDLGDHVYGPPQWPAEREMCAHHEQGHAVEFPRLLILGCRRPAASGGAALLADTRAVAAYLPADLGDRFRRHGWRLIRTFRPHLGLSWAEAFGTNDPSALERYCADRAIDSRWLADGTLRTEQRRRALIRHPETGAICWFNQVAFLSQWSVDEAERAVLLDSFGPDGLPFNTSYGNGTPLGEDEFAALLHAYDKALVRLHWQRGDVLLLDNVLTAHGRRPFEGTRRVLVAMA